MDINQFAQYVQDFTAAYLKTKTELTENLKLNGVCQHQLTITDPKSDISPMIYLEPYYGLYLRTGNLTAVIEGILKDYHHTRPIRAFGMEWFRNINQVRDKICYRLINYGANRELLDSIPHTKFLDLARVYYVHCQINDRASGHITVFNNHLDMWDISPDELDRLAEANTPILHSPVFFEMEQYAFGGTGTPEPPDEEETDDIPRMHVLTNIHKSNGAAAMCYDGPLRKYSAKTGKDTVILPSSIHDLILTPLEDTSDIGGFQKMVKEINATQLAPSNWLSDSVYIYRKDTGQIETA